MLMIFAAIGSAMIGFWAEGAILIFIFAVSGALETYTLNKSHKEISALMELQPEEAWLIQEDGTDIKVSTEFPHVGAIILVKPGERIPVDGIVTRGTTSIDMSAINGESIPVTKGKGDELFAGTVNLNGAIQMEMTKPSSETLFQKIITLVQSAQSEKSPSQQFIERFEGTYVNVVILSVIVMMFLPHFCIRLGLDDIHLSCNRPTCCCFSMCTCRFYYASDTCCRLKRSKTRSSFQRWRSSRTSRYSFERLLLIKQER